MKAAFSNAGLQATWCAQGKQAAEAWGKLMNVEITWFDGELSATKQRSAIDNMASQKWDFVAIQTFGIGTLTDPIKKMIDGGTPVIATDAQGPADIARRHPVQLVPCGDQARLAEALQRRAAAGRVRVEADLDEFDLERIAARMEQAYRTLLATKRAVAPAAAPVAGDTSLPTVAFEVRYMSFAAACRIVVTVPRIAVIATRPPTTLNSA
jgi:hypothetical protein